LVVRIHLSVLSFNKIFMLNINFHVLELKVRFYYILFSFCLTFLISYLYAETLIYLYTFPFLKFQVFSHKVIITNFIFTNISEAFNCHIYIALVLTSYFTILIFIHNLFSYLQIGLFKYEKKYLFCIMRNFICYINFLLIFLIYVILPIFLNFFLGFENEGILFTMRYEAKLIEYLIITTNFLIFSTILFSIPFIVFYLLKFNLLSMSFLKANRRLIILCVFILGALLSPPDIYSQLLIAIPLSFCFELIIFLSYLKKEYVFQVDKIFFKKH